MKRPKLKTTPEGRAADRQAPWNTDPDGYDVSLANYILPLCDDIDTLLTHIATLESQLAWQPIETAGPEWKTYKKIYALTLFGNVYNQVIVQWDTTHTEWVLPYENWRIIRGIKYLYAPPAQPEVTQ